MRIWLPDGGWRLLQVVLLKPLRLLLGPLIGFSLVGPAAGLLRLDEVGAAPRIAGHHGLDAERALSW